MTTAAAPVAAGWPAPERGTVADAMLTIPKTCPVPTTVAQARALFADDHVHALLVVERGRLVAVVDRADLVAAAAGAPAHAVGRLAGRTVAREADLAATRERMRAGGRRRLAVVDAAGGLAGLLCLQRHGRGFCTDEGVRARARERSS
jgi:CBS domain-containing protein